MGRGRGRKRYASLWCMRNKKHFIVPLTTIRNVKHRVIGTVFNYNKVETKLIDIGEDEKVLQQKAINEENVTLAIEQAKTRSEEQKIPDEVYDQKEKSAVLNSNKRKIDEKIALENNIFESSKRIMLASTTSNLSTDRGITLKNTDGSSTSSNTPSVMIQQQQQQHTSSPLTKTPSQISNDNNSLVVTESSPKQKNELSTPLMDKGLVPGMDLGILPMQHTIDSAQQQLSDNNTNSPKYHAEQIPPEPLQHTIESAQQQLSDNNINPPEYHAQQVSPGSTNVHPCQHPSLTPLFYPRLSNDEPYVLTNVDAQKQTAKIISDIPVTNKQFYLQTSTRPEPGNKNMNCMYKSPLMTTQYFRAYNSDSLESDFNGSVAFEQINHKASMSQIDPKNLQEKIYNEPPGHLSQHLKPHHESAASHSIKQQVSSTTCTKNQPKDTINPLPSTSFGDQSNICIAAPATVSPYLQSVNSNAATASDSSQENEEQANLPEVAELIATMPRGQITERDVWMQQQIYLSFKRAYELQQQASNVVDNGYKVPETFLKAGDEKVEIFPGCGFYLPKNVKTLIDFKYEEEHSWDVIVKEVLLAVYGDNIIHFSATGKGPNSRPKINSGLFRGLLAWINHGKAGKDLVDRKALIKEINHISSNKRGYKMKKQAKE